MAELKTYQAKRDFTRTAEPKGGAKRRPRKKQPRFVVQEHHARALHWDFRLERDGVLVSWAVPKGVPLDPKTNHLAVHTEDHPLEYVDFEGEIPAGEYGGGQVMLWDQGTYDVEKWEEREVMVVLHGTRVQGRYVLFRTRGKQWMMHRMDPPAEGWEPLPGPLVPMLATTGPLPTGKGWHGEFKWDGVRALVWVDGGRVTARSRNLLDITASYPELRAVGEALGARPALLDGELVAMDEQGRPSFTALQQRMKLTEPSVVRRRMAEVPVSYLVFDVLHLDGRSTTGLPYAERRALLESLGLDGAHYATPPSFDGDLPAVLQASRDQGLEGVVAKRSDSTYAPGKRADTWRKIKNIRRQEMVVGGWTQGEGSRAGHLGSLLIGYHDEHGLHYGGNVGTGFTDKTLRDLEKQLKPLRRKDSPFHDAVPRPIEKKSTYVEPTLVAEVEFTEWTKDGRMRHPSYKGLRMDKDPRDVVREDP